MCGMREQDAVSETGVATRRRIGYTSQHLNREGKEVKKG